MKIQRKRYAVMRNNRTEILSGLARNYTFKKVEEIGDTAIKTYRSNAQAYSSCSTNEFEIEVVPVMETIEVLDG